MTNDVAFGEAMRVPNQSSSGRGAKIVTLCVALFLIVAVVAGGIFAYNYKVVHKHYKIPSEAMVPTIQVGDVVSTNRISSGDTISRGEVVIFDRPAGLKDTAVKSLIKRVVAVPGDTVESRSGVLYVNGQKVVEPYLAPGAVTDNLPLTKVQADTYFVLGDNRENSADSRLYGPVERSLIKRQATEIVRPSAHKKHL